MTLLEKGSGGLEAIAGVLPPGKPVFGGVKLSSGKFVSFLYIDEDCPAMKRGRTLMYKNGMYYSCYLVLANNNKIQIHEIVTVVGVFNALEGCVGEIEMKPGLTEAEMGPVR